MCAHIRVSVCGAGSVCVGGVGVSLWMGNV